MTLFLILWFADLCDSIHNFTDALLMFAGCLSCVGLMISVVAWENMEDIIRPFLKHIKKPTIIILSLIIILNLLLPSSKTVYIATGINAIAQTTKTVADSETAKKAVELLNIKLDEYLQDAKKDK